MTSSTPSGVLTAILPCNNLDASESFYRRLGFTRMEATGHRRASPIPTACCPTAKAATSI
jgi:hypothetical protein